MICIVPDFFKNMALQKSIGETDYRRLERDSWSLNISSFIFNNPLNGLVKFSKKVIKIG